MTIARRSPPTNDTNFGSTGRNPALPDDSDFVIVRAPGIAVG